MIEDSYEFRIDEHVVGVRIQQIGNEFELWFYGPWKSKRVFVLDKSELVGLYRWLGRNLGAFGEDWKSIIDSADKWPSYMDRDELYKLAEVQQQIIERLKQNDMDDEAKNILRDIRDSLENIEEQLEPQTISMDEIRHTFMSNPEDTAQAAELAIEDYYESTTDEEFEEDVKEASGELATGEDFENVGALLGVKLEWYEAVEEECDLTDVQRDALVRVLDDADSPSAVADAAQEFMQQVSDESADEVMEEAFGDDSALDQAKDQIGND